MKRKHVIVTGDFLDYAWKLNGYSTKVKNIIKEKLHFILLSREAYLFHCIYPIFQMWRFLAISKCLKIPTIIHIWYVVFEIHSGSGFTFHCSKYSTPINKDVEKGNTAKLVQIATLTMLYNQEDSSNLSQHAASFSMSSLICNLDSFHEPPYLWPGLYLRDIGGCCYVNVKHLWKESYLLEIHQGVNLLSPLDPSPWGNMTELWPLFIFSVPFVMIKHACLVWTGEQSADQGSSFRLTAEISLCIACFLCLGTTFGS